MLARQINLHNKCQNQSKIKKFKDLCRPQAKLNQHYQYFVQLLRKVALNSKIKNKRIYQIINWTYQIKSKYHREEISPQDVVVHKVVTKTTKRILSMNKHFKSQITFFILQTIKIQAAKVEVNLGLVLQIIQTLVSRKFLNLIQMIQKNPVQILIKRPIVV